MALLAVVTAAVSVAQIPTGSWKQFNVYGDVTAMKETKDAVYVVAAGSLHSYSKKGGDYKAFAPGSDLTDFTVKDIFTDPENGSVIVTFTNGNMNLINASGAVEMIPDIKDAQVAADKVVNDVKFYNGRIYVATSFGLVVFNEKTRRVMESGIYNRVVQAVEVTDQGIVLIVKALSGDSGHELWTGPVTTRIQKLENFKLYAKFDGLVKDIAQIDTEGKKFAVFRWNGPYRFTLKPDGSLGNDRITPGNIAGFIRSEGVVYFVNRDNNLCYYNSAGNVTIDGPVPAELTGNFICTKAGRASIWAADNTGVGEYSVAADGSVTVLREKHRSPSAMTFSDAVNIFPTSDKKGIFVMNIGYTNIHPLGSAMRADLPIHLNRIENGRPEEIKPKALTARHNNTQNAFKKDSTVYCAQFVAQSPAKPERLFIGTGLEGLYVIENGVEIAHFDDTNSPLNKADNYLCRVDAGMFDKDGNFWVVNLVLDTDDQANHKVLMMLPAAKANGDLSALRPEDWVEINTGKDFIGSESKMVITNSGKIVIAQPGDKEPLVCIDTNGTPANPADDRYVSITELYDQDNKGLSDYVWGAMALDHNGQVWLGLNEGIYVIPNVDNMFKPDFRVTRVKVPRKDGSNLADYLLSTEAVSSIAVDPANRKWVGTEVSGLFLVSASGDEILANYTTDNSPLPSNLITSVYCDPNSNSVYVATSNALVELSADASPAKPDYSQTFAYPNPVEPGYTGLVTITGLMDNSLVKIMDAGMHIVAQTQSEGGMATWDLCNLGGQRVGTGVYYVVASSTSGTQSAGGVVCKIMVVN